MEPYGSTIENEDDGRCGVDVDDAVVFEMILGEWHLGSTTSLLVMLALTPLWFD